ncbi:MAG: hypothetical protein IPP71_22515 [Bacteroidetes bacterium]|nr:hypothetical protein [Bacteroidota bacterium]
MKINKKMVRIALWSFAGLALVVTLGFSSHEQETQKCLGLRIKIADETGHYFIEPKDILEVLNTKGGKIKGSAMQDINISLLEKIVYTNPFVSKAEVYSTIDGYVNIDVWQRNPIMRIVNNDNEHFYIDDNSEFMPVTDKYTSQVVVSSGNIFDDYAERSLKYAVPFTGDSTSKPVIVQLNEVALFLKGNEFWDAQIEQVFVNEKSELELIPRVGNHRILIGNSDNLEEKLARLFIFYKEGITKVGWEK